MYIPVLKLEKKTPNFHVNCLLSNNLFHYNVTLRGQ